MRNPYRRLPGRRWLSPGLIHQLWVAPDHLLAIENNRYTETYRRFDFREIQALISRRSRRRLTLSLALGIPAVLMLLLGSLGGWEGVGAALVVAAPLLLAVLANVLRGPTCVSHLRTAVSLVELPSLARVRSFERAVRVLRPHLEAAQGALATEAMEEGAARMPWAPPRPVAAVAPRSPVVRRGTGAAHDVLFGLLVAIGLVGLLRSELSSHVLTGLGVALFLVTIFALLVALVRQQDTDLAAGVRRLAWVALGLVVVSFGVFYILLMIEMMRSAKAGEGDAMLQFLAGGAERPAGLLSIAQSLAGIGVGVVGWLRLRAFRARRHDGGRRMTPPSA